MIDPLMIGNIFTVEIEPHGNKREIHDHFLCKLDTITANTVLDGSLGSKFGAKRCLSLYAISDLTCIHPLEL